MPQDPVKDRRAAVLSLARGGETLEAAFALAIGALGDEDERVRLLAVEAIGRIDSREARARLFELTASDEEWIRRISTGLVMRLQTREAWPVLVRAATDEHPGVAILAIEGLGKLAGPGDIAEFLALADVTTGRASREARLWAERIDRGSRDKVQRETESRTVTLAQVSEADAEASAARRNAELGAVGDQDRYAIAVAAEDKTWNVEERKVRTGWVSKIWRALLDL